MSRVDAWIWISAFLVSGMAALVWAAVHAPDMTAEEEALDRALEELDHVEDFVEAWQWAESDRSAGR